MEFERIGACRRPYTQNQRCIPPLIRPPLWAATFPQGKAKPRPGKSPKIGKNPEKIRFSLTNGGKRTIIYKVILSLGFPGPENSEIISERKLKYV